MAKARTALLLVRKIVSTKEKVAENMRLYAKDWWICVTVALHFSLQGKIEHPQMLRKTTKYVSLFSLCMGVFSA